MKVYKANGKKKVSVVAICLLLTVVLTVGGTLAYLFTSTGSVTNTFTPAKTDIEVEEPNWNGLVKSDVTIKNTGDIKAFIRAKIVVNWQNSTNIIPAADTDYEWDINTTGDENGKWVKIGDFYYYNKPIDPGFETGVLIENAAQAVEAPIGYKAVDGYKLHIEVLAQSVQAEGVDKNGVKPVVLAWGVDPSTLK